MIIKAKILLKISNRFKKGGRKVSARTYALRALSNQPSLGRAYLLIASLYADSANDLRLRIKFDTPGHEGQEKETENKSTFKIREQ